MDCDRPVEVVSNRLCRCVESSLSTYGFDFLTSNTAIVLRRRRRKWLITNVLRHEDDAMGGGGGGEESLENKKTNYPFSHRDMVETIMKS